MKTKPCSECGDWIDEEELVSGICDACDEALRRSWHILDRHYNEGSHWGGGE